MHTSIEQQARQLMDGHHPVYSWDEIVSFYGLDESYNYDVSEVAQYLTNYMQEPDEREDDGYIPNKPKTNEDLVRDLMNYNPTGAVCQMFIMEAIQKYAKACAAADPKTFDNAMISGAAWVKCAQHIKEKCDAFYARHDRPAAANDE